MIKYINWEPVDEVDQRKKLNQSGKWPWDTTVGIPVFRGQTGKAETAKETEQSCQVDRRTREDGISEKREEMWPVEPIDVERL